MRSEICLAYAMLIKPQWPSDFFHKNVFSFSKNVFLLIKIYFHCFFIVVPVDQGAGMTTNEVLQVVDSIPPGPEGMIVAVPGSVGALEPDAIDTTTLLSQVN